MLGVAFEGAAAFGAASGRAAPGTTTAIHRLAAAHRRSNSSCGIPRNGARAGS